ncbi:EEF1A lysine methyltransferase 4 isoform X2 [Nematostella vectensis]|uniref:EEF1A lysine methyltransferase 4 isoform X2 n=1 Tax=Nematostella vectensis TaxID=45351 RepID=UPI0020777C86|nr:EEF1A lysine methyltransferase 4 isoform X2 [Nematostella vectensis]
MDLPKDNSSYKDKEYWNNRFAKEDTFEWCKSYKEFRHLLRGHVRTCDRVLILGCGNSGLSEDMYNEGYTDITNIDYSPIVIENMKRKCHAMRGMEWKVMDITKLDFPPNSFDVVIEKATLDALLVAEKDPWNPSVEALKTMECVLSKDSWTRRPSVRDWLHSPIQARPNRHDQERIYRHARVCQGDDKSTRLGK